MSTNNTHGANQSARRAEKRAEQEREKTAVKRLDPTFPHTAQSWKPRSADRLPLVTPKT